MLVTITESQRPRLSFPEIIDQLVKAGFLLERNPPLIRGKVWQQVQRRCPGCFADISFRTDGLEDPQVIKNFTQAFGRVICDLEDLSSTIGSPGYEQAIGSILRCFPNPETEDFAYRVSQAAQNAGLDCQAILTIRAIRIFTLAIDLGLLILTG